MKKIQTTFLCFATIFVLASCSSTVLMTSGTKDPGTGKNNVSINNTVPVPEKVQSAFAKIYGSVANIDWSLDNQKNFCAYFYKDGKTVRSTFSRQADFLGSLSTYTEEALATDILLKIKESYYKKNITSVEEINAAGKTAYIIGLEDNTTWMKIKLLDGEITEGNIYLK